MRGEARDITKPEPGFWAIRLVKKGPEVPAAIIRIHTRAEPGNPTNLMERSPFLVATIAGKSEPLGAVWERRGRVITQEEYKFMLADQAWCRDYAPDEPKANPKRAVDLSRLPVILPPS